MYGEVADKDRVVLPTTSLPAKSSTFESTQVLHIVLVIGLSKRSDCIVLLMLHRPNTREGPLLLQARPR